MAIIMEKPMATGEAIYHPTLVNKFEIKFQFNLDAAVRDVLTRSVRSAFYDYKNKIITVNLEQPDGIPNIHWHIMDILHLKYQGQIDTITNAGCISYMGCTGVEHSYSLDYTSPTTPATHVLKFSFVDIIASSEVNLFEVFDN